MPAIISKEEVGSLIEAAPNLKHQVFLTFLYTTGVRLSEATNVKIEDIDSERMQIYIHRGKGAKDRKVVLNQKLLDLLRNYFKIYRPKESTSQTVNEIASNKAHLGAKTGMISMLHTFGSDMKYHVHNLPCSAGFIVY